jgi:site-specific DNA-methyltransferase (cytosine-N4-specific)
MSCLINAEKYPQIPLVNDERNAYLHSWFPADYLQCIEKLRYIVEQSGTPSTNILLVIASNLLRDYSLQEPHDLRIRRRKSPFPEKTFFQAYREALQAFCSKLSDFQKTFGIIKIKQRAINIDCKKVVGNTDLIAGDFDLALTSPPYATALPYIDTQRLSLVWLGLLAPSDVMLLEAELVGSREIRGLGKKTLLTTLENNGDELPDNEANFCLQLQEALAETDGFRRQVVPRLLYRYFSAMSDAFTSVRRLVKKGAPFGLIVGGNHTVLGGSRFDINTPQHLANLAVSRGWQHVETIPLQTYKRYGLHQSNATTTEALIILKAEAS